MSRLLLVRHGITEANSSRRFAGYSDVELSAEGYRQVERLRDRLLDKKIDAVYSSDLKRAMATAEIISSEHNLDIVTCPELREMNYGDAEGLTFDEISRLYPEAAEMVADFNLRLEFPGGDIGRLAVAGTVNDLAVMGATPTVLSLGLILEEGLSLDVLDRIVVSIASTANEAGVSVVTGDTKVVDRGKGDGVFINPVPPKTPFRTLIVPSQHLVGLFLKNSDVNQLVNQGESFTLNRIRLVQAGLRKWPAFMLPGQFTFFEVAQ